MKKIILSILVCLVCSFVLTSCGVPTPPKEQEIARTMPEEITTLMIQNPFTGESEMHELEIKSFAIEKRQTNEKDDTVYCVIDLQDEWYHFKKYVVLNYIYYDRGGWLLEKWDNTTLEWEVLEFPFTSEEVVSQARREYEEVGNIALEEQNLKNGIACFSAQAKNHYVNGSYQYDLFLTCQFDGIKWEYEEIVEDGCVIWDIVGKWEYREESSTGKNVKIISLIIQDFDPDTLSMNGTWYMRYTGYGTDVDTTISLSDKERFEVKLGDRGQTLWLQDKLTSSWVSIKLSKVEGNFRANSLWSYFGLVSLTRIE